MACPWAAASAVPDGNLSYLGDTYQLMQTTLAAYMAGTTPTVAKLPVFFNIICNLLAPHTQRFRVNEIKYSWGTPYILDNDMIPTVIVSGRTKYFVLGAPAPFDTESPNQPIEQFSAAGIPTESAFQAAMGLLRDSTRPDTEIVGIGEVTFGLRDPGAYGRSYTYLGLGNSPAGQVYGSCELETAYIRSWIPAQFCPYVDGDVRVSHSFRTKSGDSSLLVALPWLGDFTMKSIKQNGPIIYKFIDFEEIYFWVINWYTEALFQVMNNNATASNGGPVTMVNQLPISCQTFRIVLRQALLQIFTDQHIGQFMCPRPTSGTQDDNVFVPFLLNGGTFSSTNYNQFKLPQVLVENLRMLKTFQPKSKTKTRVTYVPVLGYWDLDIFNNDPDLKPGQIFNSEGTRNGKLFLLPPNSENPVDLVDGLNGAVSSPTVVNLNNQYYQAAAGLITQSFSLLTGTGGELSTVAGDSGPGLSLLNFTRFVKTQTSQEASESLIPYAVVMEHACRLRKQDSKKMLLKEKDKPTKGQAGNAEPKTWISHGRVFSNPPGGVNIDYTEALTANLPITSEIASLLTKLIIPTLRANEQSPNAQIPSEWQIANIEPYRMQPNVAATTSSATVRAVELSVASTSPITSVTSGATSDEFVKLMQDLAASGKSVNWGALLSGAIQVGGMVVNALTS